MTKRDNKITQNCYKKIRTHPPGSYQPGSDAGHSQRL